MLAMLLLRLLSSALLPLSAYSLSCYICGEGNLDEFGECSTQFQYDCQNYAARFRRDEKIFCRSTRHKAPNSTYTIMKECISEQDHYHTFPNKGYSIDEECDLVDVNGHEVAYCLCSLELCNKPSIADQFIAFEEKNPELFGDLEPSSATLISKGQAPLTVPAPLQTVPIGFIAPPVPPPPIVPINDPRHQQPGFETEVRRVQLPTREKSPGNRDSSNDGSNHLTAEAGQSIARALETNRHAGAVPAPPPAPPWHTQQQQPPHTPKSGEASPGLRCSQCVQSNLPSSNSDCDRQTTILCHDVDAVCFTRQILLSAGQAAVEKMCVSWEAVKQEFPTSSKDSCGEVSDGRVRYCTCTQNDCNSMAIFLQIAKGFKTDPLPPFVRAHAAGSSPQVAAPEFPFKAPSDGTIAVPSIQPLTRMPAQGDSASSAHEKSEKDPAAPSPQPIEPILHEGSKSHKPAITVELPDPIEPVSASEPVLRCSACFETGVTDPTADCSSSAPAMCPSNEKFCLSRQTQHEDATFTLEKRCVSEATIITFTKSSDVQLGCATADAGMVNYCVCKKDLCNRDSLLAQAQISGVRRPGSTSNSRASKPNDPPEVDPPKTQPSSVPSVFLDNNEAPNVEEVSITETRINDQEQDVSERQKHWSDADLSSSSTVALWPALFLGLLAI